MDIKKDQLQSTPLIFALHIPRLTLFCNLRCFFEVISCVVRCVHQKGKLLRLASGCFSRLHTTNINLCLCHPVLFFPAPFGSLHKQKCAFLNLPGLKNILLYNMCTYIFLKLLWIKKRNMSQNPRMKHTLKAELETPYLSNYWKKKN